MTPTRIKICGITRAEDGVAAAKLGADAIGLVFYDRSPRHIGIGQARDIIAVLPPFVKVVALFMNAPAGDVLEVLDRVPIDLLQFHGDEDAGYCQGFDRPYIKAVPMAGDNDVQAYSQCHKHAAGLLLDSHALGEAGGSGTTFDWDKAPRHLDKPLILAGGLTPQNVEDGVRRVRPYAVDVSSGVESAKGIKDAQLMAEFIEGVRRGQS
ncbi:MAG: phosphoribosylanthranilate isomerase [Gammaproteobacteria bacterium]|nr:phosphoribosylanthranilate isomerase [Gammaproteobacteria bacterium]MCP5137474.1 phosphoribosylanthranilate isomerase [Gammaproteobacteria bacterium]